MIEQWIRQDPNNAMGFLLPFIIALDVSTVLMFHSGISSGRKRAWYRRWSKRLASLNGLLVRAVLVLWLVLHVWWVPQ